MGPVKMKNKLLISLSLSLGTLLTVVSYPSLSGELNNGRTFFSKSPRLLDVMTTFQGVRIPFPSYYYTIELPDQSGESLQRVMIKKREGSDTIEYNTDQTIAFEGTPNSRGDSIKVKDTQWDENTETLMITLDTPVAPGKVFTIGLKPKKNPEFSGIYLFGVTVFPVGNNPMHLYLGSGRLQFYGSEGGVKEVPSARLYRTNK
jgi:hypothetical protein